LARELRKLG